MRKTAEQSLRKLQPSAVEIIQRHLRSSDDPEVKIRLRRIIAHITHHRLDMKTLESIVIPEIDFRQANIHDCLLFLETASAEVGSSTNKSSRKRVKFITKFSAAAEEGVPFITFKARYINLHEALKIITEISNLQFHIEGGAVIVEEWKHSR
ncbi:MAG: hypothetical protein QGH15_20980 [Kiritimatiellia bacterium]|nr:hypothetical protein [Kiritimatiellia bacterium]